MGQNAAFRAVFYRLLQGFRRIAAASPRRVGLFFAKKTRAFCTFLSRAVIIMPVKRNCQQIFLFIAEIFNPSTDLSLHCRRVTASRENVRPGRPDQPARLPKASRSR
jgi:hypothetical protein